MVHVAQIAEHIVEPALRELGLYSRAALRLVMGTGAHESDGFRYLKQIRGPALSWFQIEPATHADLWQRTIPRIEDRRPELAAALFRMARRSNPGTPTADELLRNPYYAAAVCRMLYWRTPDALPDEDDLDGMAELWKRRYNTIAGAGRPAQWLDAYRRHCGGRL